jgi:hypothetical protein
MVDNEARVTISMKLAIATTAWSGYGGKVTSLDQQKSQNRSRELR